MKVQHLLGQNLKYTVQNYDLPGTYPVTCKCNNYVYC